MSRFLHVLEAIEQPWLITPEGYAAVRALVERHVLAGDGLAELAAVKLDDLFPPRPAATFDTKTGIAEVPVFGTIGKGLSRIEKSCGAVSTEDIAADLAQAQANPGIRGVLLHVSSPGGMVNGTPELAAQIRSLGKPTVAYTDSMMGSAAYWLGSQADLVLASPSASVGSIGVYIPYADQSRRYEQEGVKVDVIRNKEGVYKGMGLPGTALSEGQREHLQERVDQIFAMFAGDVLAKRRCGKDAMKGQSFLGGEALARGLVDDVGSLGYARQTLAGLISVRGSERTRAHG
jgi:signal peptide peptidase SppA